jgi:non-specific serine/threonine protein kinase
MANDSKDDDNTRTHVVLTKGTMVSHYRIVEKIGAGGMGEVYLAEDTELDRKVALKFLPPHLCHDEDCRARFKREAQAAAKLDHPNIVTVHEVGEYQGRPYFAMAHVEGQSLKEYSAGKELSIEQILELGIQISEGLQAAHDKGITHRDIKPSNILIDSHGRARIVDFGLASVVGKDQLTKTGSTLGTIGYMSPEQVRGQDIDHRSDLFSLGVVLYELITHQNPFKRDSEAATLKAVSDDTPEPLARYKSSVSEELQRIVSKLLEKTPELRYQHAGDLLADLKKASQQSEAGVSQEQPSIAVLPFTNLSADPEQEYFCDGMAEEIINALTHIENLRVIARTSAFAFKGRLEDVREIGRKLGVGTLLEGSVRKAGTRLRIAAQLVKVIDGSHLWSERYDREMEDVFAIQDEISLMIVEKLKVKLLGVEKTRLIKRCTEHIEAYNLYLKGRYFWNKRGEGLKKSLGYFRQALEKDSNYALAYAGLADSYMLLGFYSYLPPKQAFPEAEAAALKALRIDPTLAEPRSCLGFVRLTYNWDWLAAEKEFKQAIELDPNCTSAHYWYASLLLVMDQYELAIQEGERAVATDPLSIFANTHLAWTLMGLRQYRRAKKQLLKTLDLDPSFALAHWLLGAALGFEGKYEEGIIELQKAADLSGNSPWMVATLGYTYAAIGRSNEARKVLVRLQKRLQQEYTRATLFAAIYANLGDADRAFEWLNTAYEERDMYLVFIKKDVAFDCLHSDPRFPALLKKIGLG